MRLAREEAHRLKHESITAEHILLGLLNEGSGVTASMLTRIERDFGKVRSELIEKMDTATARDIPLAKLPYTAECNVVMEHAYSEAQNCDSRRIEPVHLLLGLTRCPETFAGKVLQALGINADDIKKDIAKID